MPACLECMLVHLIIRRWTWSQCRSAFIPLSDRSRFAAAILGWIVVAGGLPVVDRRTSPSDCPAWSGKAENFAAGQRAFSHRAKMNGAAAQGKYTETMEKAA